jgi:hypothetical protein
MSSSPLASVGELDAGWLNRMAHDWAVDGALRAIRWTAQLMRARSSTGRSDADAPPCSAPVYIVFAEYATDLRAGSAEARTDPDEDRLTAIQSLLRTGRSLDPVALLR